MPTATSRSVTPTFEGFADTRGRFFEALRLHNDRDWFTTHREEYERGWLAPMKALLAGLKARLAPAYRGLPLAEPRIFRIQRDLRFAKEKVPYKTHVAGMVPLAGPAGPFGGPAAIYVHVGSDEAMTGAGIYVMDPARLARHRRDLLDPRRGAALSRLVAALEQGGFELEAMETLQRTPKGVPPDHPRAALLRMKGLVAMAPIERRLLARAALVDALEAQGRAMAPLVRWLAG